MSDNEQKISKYSSGVNIIFRLDSLWKISHLHVQAGRYSHWNIVLDCIWRELARDLNDKNFGEKKEELKEIDARLKLQLPFNDSAPAGFREPTEKEIESRNKIYEILGEKQIFLSRLENFLGKGTTEADDDEDDFD